MLRYLALACFWVALGIGVYAGLKVVKDHQLSCAFTIPEFGSQCS